MVRVRIRIRIRVRGTVTALESRIAFTSWCRV
jgi:hypothetical protein